MNKFIYRDLRKTAGCFTVGYFDPNGYWEPESDHDTEEEAAKRCVHLNGEKYKEVIRDFLGFMGDVYEKDPTQYTFSGAQIYKLQQALKD